MPPLFLFRYDTEAHWDGEDMTGFFETAVRVHRAGAVPATFFCQGAAIEKREADFRAFFEEVKDDPLFDIQDHSYSHIGVCYEAGKPVDVLRADYARSFAVHERVFGRRPRAISLCGTSGADGKGLRGFDATEKSRAELDMLAELGVDCINTALLGVDGSREFVSYAALGHPDVMGFPSGFGDTGWLYRRAMGDPMEYILGAVRERAAEGAHMPLMLHDWAAYNHGPDRALSLVTRIADLARELGFELRTHTACHDDGALWRGKGAPK